MNTSIQSQPPAAHKPARKRVRVILALLDGPKTSFELEKAPTFDHCANSTVSELRKSGVEILTEMVTVSGYQGEPARIAKYTLEETSRQRAQQLIEAAK